MKLTVLYDGGCPLCRREVDFLTRHDKAHNLKFVDIDRKDYNPEHYNGITYKQAMENIHAIQSDGTILKNLAVFREAYKLIGLGWLYKPTDWPLIAPLSRAVYALWASNRLKLTGRGTMQQQCTERCKITPKE